MRDRLPQLIEHAPRSQFTLELRGIDPVNAPRIGAGDSIDRAQITGTIAWMAMPQLHGTPPPVVDL